MTAIATPHRAPHRDGHSRLEHAPVSLFAIVMGLTGLTLALHSGESALHYGAWPVRLMFWVSAAVFLAIAALYGAKALRHPAAVREEWNHPVRLVFFPTISISLLLLATAALVEMPGLARVLWGLGAALQLGLTLAVASGWIGHRPFQPPQMSPAWFIPAVGNVIVPVAGVPLGYVELSWFFFALGLMFWVVLLTLVMNRLIFHDPLPGRLQPTLMILVAPPAVAFVAWLRLNGGQIDAPGRILLNMAYVFALVMVVRLPGILRLPFVLSFWALSFPVAALTIATFAFAARTGSGFHAVLAPVLLAGLAVLIAGLMVRTLRAIAAAEICRPE